MENTATLDELWIQSQDEEEAFGNSARREVFLKQGPPRWKPWAMPSYHNVSWYFRDLDYPQMANRVWKNPHLYFREDVLLERMTNPRGRVIGIQEALSALYEKKYHAGPSKWYDVGIISLVIVLGSMAFAS